MKKKKDGFVYSQCPLWFYLVLKGDQWYHIPGLEHVESRTSTANSRFSHERYLNGTPPRKLSGVNEVGLLCVVGRRLSAPRSKQEVNG